MLTAKQQRFVDEFSIDHNGSRAARAAGYSAVSAKVTASRLLTNANVRAAVTVRQIEAERALEITRADVLKGLQEAFEAARQQREPMAMIAACRAIAQVCGFYREMPLVAKEMRHSPMQNKLEAMDDAALAALIAGG